MHRLEVKTRKLQFVALALLGLFFVPLGGMIVIDGLRRGDRMRSVIIGAMCLAPLAGVAWLVLRADRKSIRYLSDDGLTRRDGRHLAWTDLHRVVDQCRFTASGKKLLWRTEVHFKKGESAWLLPQKVINGAEVYRVLQNLPCEHVDVRV